MKEFIIKLHCYDDEPVVTTEDPEEEIQIDLDIEVGRKSNKSMVIHSSEEDDDEPIGTTGDPDKEIDLNIDVGESMVVLTSDDE